MPTTLSAIDKADEILDAISRGSLAVFAGAGVSMGHEMQLPGFAGLAKEITRRCHRPSPANDEGHLDKFLGDLCDDFQVDVHGIAGQIIYDSRSKCNPMHKDLLGLFKTGDRVKIVTTNYDQGFEFAASLSGITTRSYSAPALPLGSDFEGIVHVHGSMDGRQGMVITDRDYGRAYLTEGWARRFLIGLFSRHSILFIGYSHRDSDLNYLVRALGAGEEKLNRYAWIAAEDLKEGDAELSLKWWKGYGVIPVVFENYEAIADGVRLLVQYVDPSPEATRDRISKLVSLAPSLSGRVPLEVKLALEKEETARYFTNFAKSPDWVRILNRDGYLDFLFSKGPISPVQEVVAIWVAREFLGDDSEVLFEIIAGRMFGVNDQFRRMLLFAIRANKEWPNKPQKEFVLGRWVALILRTFEVSPGERSLLEFLAERCVQQGCSALAVDVFLQMADHRVVPIKRTYLTDDGVRMKVELTSEYYNLNKVWQECLKPKLSDISEKIFAGICDGIEKMHLESGLWAGDEWHEVFWRSAIEPHDQDKGRHDGFGVLVDAARDSIEYLGATDPDGFYCRAERLLASACWFHRRLGIHALRVHSHYSANEKIQMLLEHLKLSSREEHHEAYLLISECYAEATEEVRGFVRLHISGCAADLASRPGCDEESGDWFSLLWLDCLVRSAPDCVHARENLSQLKVRRPGWTVGDHPSFRRYIGSGEWVDPRPEYYADQIVTMPCRSIVDWYSDNAASDSCRALSVQLTKACKLNTGYAFRLLEYLKSVSDWTSKAWEPVLDAFSDGSFPLDRIQDVLSLISEPALFDKFARPIADFIEACVKNHGRIINDDLMARLADFSDLVWQACSEPDLTEARKLDWLGTAINDPSGRIVLSWVEMLSVSMEGKVGVSRCLPAPMEGRLSLALTTQSSKADMARVILASQYRFFHGLNSKWSRDHLLPLFTSKNETHFQQAWDGFLTWGSLSPSVEADLRPAFMAAIKRLVTSLSDNRCERFIRFYAIMAVYQQDDPVENFLPEFLVNSDTQDGSFRARFASSVCFIMRQMSYDDQTRVGKKWVLKYCQRRSQNLPVRLSDGELSELLNLIAHSGSVFPDLVDVFSRLRAVKFNSIWLYEIEDVEIAKKHPAALARLLIYMSKCEGASGSADAFRRISEMIQGLPPDLAGSLRSSMVSIGIN
jgi:hypothetical protein